MKAYVLKFLGILFLFIAQPALAEDAMTGMPDEVAMQKAMELGMPGVAHKVLEPLVGQWTYTMTHKMAADAPEQMSEGTSNIEWILGGRFLQQKVSSTLDMGGQTINYEGIGTIGHDNVKGRYMTSWMDNMSTGIMTAVAEYDEAAATLKEKGSYSCPMKGRDVNFTSELKIIDNDHFSYTMYETDEGGTTYKMMDIQYTRQQ